KTDRRLQQPAAAEDRSDYTVALGVRDYIAGLCLCAVLASCLHAAARPPQDADAPASLVRESRIAPDGQSVAFTFQPPSIDTNRPAPANVWKVSFAGGPPLQLT